MRGWLLKRLSIAGKPSLGNGEFGQRNVPKLTIAIFQSAFTET